MFVASVFLGTYLATSLLPAVAVGALLAVIVRAPIIRPRGTVRLETDADPEAVVDSFTGPTPPMLVFQWGVADRVSTGNEGVTYHLSYLFGIRSVEMTVHRRSGTTTNGGRSDTTTNGSHTVELEVTANHRPWSTYTVTIAHRDCRTVVEYEYAAARRFGLRRVPQRILAERYRDVALAAQGYTVIERDERRGL